MVTRKTIYNKLKEEILTLEREGWKYGDLLNLARKYEYHTDTIHRIRRKLRKQAKENESDTR